MFAAVIETLEPEIVVAFETVNPPSTENAPAESVMLSAFTLTEPLV